MNCPECNSDKLLKRGFRGGKQRYRCKECGRCFVEGTKFVGRQVKLPSVVKSCPHCGETKVIRDGLLETGGQRYKCLSCGKGFSSKTIISTPVKYDCPYCGGKLRRAGLGKRGQHQYQCKDCGKTCSGDPPVVRQYFSQINDKVLCPYCDSKNIVLRGTVKEKFHRFLCKDCGKAFTEETKERLERIKNEERSKEVCPRCGGTRIISAGKSRDKQRYRCLDCKRSYTKGAKLMTQDLKRKPALTAANKRLILMYRFNLGLSREELAQHFNCSKYSIIQLEKEVGMVKR